MLAVVLVVSVPVMAGDLEVECEADSGVCKEQVTYETRHEGSGWEPQKKLFEDSVKEGSGEECFPFCMRWWPY